MSTPSLILTHLCFIHPGDHVRGDAVNAEVLHEHVGLEDVLLPTQLAAGFEGVDLRQTDRHVALLQRLVEVDLAVVALAKRAGETVELQGNYSYAK